MNAAGAGPGAGGGGGAGAGVYSGPPYIAQKDGQTLVARGLGADLNGCTFSYSADYEGAGQKLQAGMIFVNGNPAGAITGPDGKLQDRNDGVIESLSGNMSAGLTCGDACPPPTAAQLAALQVTPADVVTVEVYRVTAVGTEQDVVVSAASITCDDGTTVSWP